MRLSNASRKSRSSSTTSKTSLWGTAGPEETERRERVEKAQERKKQLISVLPKTCESTLSGWTRDGLKESKIPNCPPGCESILGSDALYVQPAYEDSFESVFTSIELKQKYEILDKNDRLLYYAAETLEDLNCFPSGKKDGIDLTVLGPNGGLIFEIIGSLKKNEVATVANDNAKFGSIKQTKTRCGSKTLILLNENDQELFRVVNVSNSFYQIFAVGSDVVCGEIKLSTKPPPSEKKLSPKSTPKPAPSTAAAGITSPSNTPPTPPKDNSTAKLEPSTISIVNNTNTKPPSRLSASGSPSLSTEIYGVTFPPQQDLNSKILLLSTLMLLNYVHFAPINYGPNKQNFMFGLLYNGVIAVLILAMIIIAIILPYFKKTENNMTKKKE